MTTLLLKPYVSVLVMLTAQLPEAARIKPRCGWAHQLMPGLNNIVANIMGVALSLGQLLFLGALALLIVLVATKHGSTLIKIVLGVIVFSLLLNSGWLPINSPC